MKRKQSVPASVVLIMLVAALGGAHAQDGSCPDPDGDGICSDVDNCPTLSNSGQESFFRLSDSASLGIKLGNPYVVSPDSSTVAYVDREPSTFHWRLNLVRFDEAIPVPIDWVAGVTSLAFDYVFTADGTRLVFTAYDFGSSTSRLFSVPVAGGPVVQLSGTTSLLIDAFEVCADGTKVVFREDDGGGAESYFRVVPTTGGTPLELMGPSEFHDNTGAFAVSPDCSTVVVQFFDGTSSLLYSVPVAGGTPVQLNQTPVAIFGILDFIISPDGSTVVFRSDEESDGVVELFSVPISGGAVTKVSGEMVAGGDVGTAYSFWTFYEVTADSATVVYIADQDIDGVSEIYSGPIAGGVPVKLNDPLVAGGDVTSFEFDPAGSTVLFTADAVIDKSVELYSIPAIGGSAVRLNGALTPGGSVVRPFAVSSDGSTVLYRADQEVDGVEELYAVPAAGGTAVKLNDPLPAGGGVSRSFGTADGLYAAYSADESVAGQMEVHSVPLGGGSSTRISGPLAPGETVPSHSLSPDGLAVAYSAGVPGDETVDALYAAPLVADADGDGVLLFCDCAPFDPGISDVAEVDGVAAARLDGTGVRMSWPASTGADSYSVSRGLLAGIALGDYGACLEPGIAELFVDDADVPLAGEAFVYLVQPTSEVCGVGPLGRNSSGTERSSSNPAACS